MQSLLKNKMAFIFFLGVCFYGFPYSASGKAVSRPDLTYQEGLVSMEAYHMPLFKILEVLSEKAGIDFFVSEDFEAEDISVFLVEEPIDEALKRILRHYNHAAVYAKDGEDWRLTAVKIYPKGKYGGKVVPLYSGSKVLAAAKAVGETKTVVVFSGKPMTTYGKLGKGGKLVPSRSFLNLSPQQLSVNDKQLFSFQRQLERRETEKYEELMQLREELNATGDPDRIEALTKLLGQELDHFYDMKKNHLNMVEDLKRLLEHKKLTETLVSDNQGGSQ